MYMQKYTGVDEHTVTYTHAYIYTPRRPSPSWRRQISPTHTQRTEKERERERKRETHANTQTHLWSGGLRSRKRDTPTHES